MQRWMKHLGVARIGLMSLCLTMLLVSCVTVPMPPAHYLQATPITEPKSGQLTNGDVARLAQDRAFDTEKANADKAAIRAWYEGYCAARAWLCRTRKD